MAGLDRSAFIALLNRLGADSDEDVLAAARELHRGIAEAGVTWDDLLIPDRQSASAAEPDKAGSAAADRGTVEDAILDEEAENEPEEEEDEEEEDDEDDETADADDEPDDNEEGDDQAVPDEPRAANPDEDARIIDRLLEQKGLSQETRDELAAFRADIANGRLSSMDSRYIRALARRLGA